MSHELRMRAITDSDDEGSVVVQRSAEKLPPQELMGGTLLVPQWLKLSGPCATPYFHLHGQNGLSDSDYDYLSFSLLPTIVVRLSVSSMTT
jgi:hypothetical protein